MRAASVTPKYEHTACKGGEVDLLQLLFVPGGCHECGLALWNLLCYVLLALALTLIVGYHQAATCTLLSGAIPRVAAAVGMRRFVGVATWWIETSLNVVAFWLADPPRRSAGQRPRARRPRS